MADELSLFYDERDWLNPYLVPGKHDNRKPLENGRPFVTLTYAQSMDGMISLGKGIRTTLSGPETKSVTHWLRHNHDAILVGSGTAVIDDPSLNCRYFSVTTPPKHPIPVIVDPNGRWNYEQSKIAQLERNGNGKKPLIIRRHRKDHTQAAIEGERDALDYYESSADPPTKKLDWAAILQKLKCHGINSLMVEGGAGVIKDLLAKPDLIDTVIITIAPTWLGAGGVLATPPPKNVDDIRTNAVNLKEPSWRTFGKDIVLCGRPKR